MVVVVVCVVVVVVCVCVCVCVCVVYLCFISLRGGDFWIRSSVSVDRRRESELGLPLCTCYS